MSLISRVPRPLARDKETLRDARLFIIACDDTYAPDQYFKFFQLQRVKLHVVPTVESDSHAAYVLARLKEFDYEEGDQRWLLLDTDHCCKREHLKKYTAALADAKKAGVQVALSKPCFELWLLLHHVEPDVVGQLKNAGEVERALSQVLGSYDKTNLRLADFPPASLVRACQRARQLDAQVAGGDIPQTNTSRVYLLWLAIAECSSLLQLPEELRELKNLASLK